MVIPDQVQLLCFLVLLGRVGLLLQGIHQTHDQYRIEATSPIDPETDFSTPLQPSS